MSSSNEDLSPATSACHSGRGSKQSIRKRGPDNNWPSTMPRRKKTEDVTTPAVQSVHVTDADGTVYSIPTQNEFALLGNKEDEINTNAPKPGKPNAQSTKKERIPPIAVPALTYKEIEKVLSDASISEYKLKFNTDKEVGTYVFLSTAADHVKAREYLTTKEVGFFSHDLPNEKFFKVVLSGLQLMDLKDLKEELAKVNVFPVDIKVIKPKQARYDNHANYILYFNRGTVDFERLKVEVRAVMHLIVRWDRYRHVKGQTTQCRRCQLPGHGTRHCNLTPKCMNCAGQHLTEQCEPMKTALVTAKQEHVRDGKPDDSTVQVKFPWKCANCGGAHRADDRQCKKIAEYNEVQRRLSNRNRQRQQQFQYQEASFPNELQATAPPLPTQSTSRAHYSQALATGRSLNHNLPMSSGYTVKGMGPVNSPVNLESHVPFSSSKLNPDQELFSFNEINSLTHEMLRGLSTCKNKSEQFELITNLAVKYLYGHK